MYIIIRITYLSHKKKNSISQPFKLRVFHQTFFSFCTLSQIKIERYTHGRVKGVDNESELPAVLTLFFFFFSFFCLSPLVIIVRPWHRLKKGHGSPFQIKKNRTFTTFAQSSCFTTSTNCFPNRARNFTTEALSHHGGAKLATSERR